MSQPCSCCKEYGAFAFPYIDRRGCHGMLCERCLSEIVNNHSIVCDECKRPMLLEGETRVIYKGREMSICPNCYRKISERGM